ncbi:MAG: sigma-70 family RNA polymerase sigma factor, partial [Clostridia bacterium]|nr:sigma-70 family RNA polymerase sigma factor [Clostridia bacterium]
SVLIFLAAGNASSIKFQKRGGCTVPTSSFDETHEFDMAIFDGYSRTVLKNSCIDAKKEIHKQRDNEISSTELMQYINETAGQEDMYPSEFVISVKGGYNCVVTLEWLYKAMLLLPENQKEVLMGN